MYYCSTCGSKYINSKPGCGCNTHQSYGGHHTAWQQPGPYYPQSHPNYCPTTSPCETVFEGVLGRSINDGLWRVLDNCGKPVPYAWIEVLYTGTTVKAPIGYKKDMKPEHLYPMNPVQADHNGVVRLFYKGGPVDIIFYKNCNGAPGEVIDRITDVGGFEEGDFPLNEREDKECIDIENPLVSIYDKDNCNQPAFLTTPLALLIRANIDGGLPAGLYADVKAYFQCLGEPFPDGLLVYGSCGACLELFKYKGTCPEECPPDPCTVEFDEDGESPCWSQCKEPEPEQPALPIFANARFNNPTASTATPQGTRAILEGISANRFTDLQNDDAGVFTGVANGIRVNRTGYYIIVTQIRTNTFDPSGSVPAGFHAECDGLFVNGTFFGSMPNEEKTNQAATSISAWQIMSHNHVYLNADDVIAPAALSLSHDNIVWSGETAMTFMGY